MSDEGEVRLDRELLRSSATGDREAFLRFMTRHQAAVLRFCGTLISRSGDSEDILQETFLTAWQRAETYQGRGSARSWLFTIARRKVYRANRSTDPLGGGGQCSLEELGLSAGWGTVLAREQLGMDERLRFREAFERLSAADRQVLLLRDLEGFTNAESAEILNIEVAAMKSRLHRARLRLMGLLVKGVRHAG